MSHSSIRSSSGVGVDHVTLGWFPNTLETVSSAEVALQAVLNRLPVNLARAFHLAFLLFR